MNKKNEYKNSSCKESIIDKSQLTLNSNLLFFRREYIMYNNNVVIVLDSAGFDYSNGSLQCAQLLNSPMYSYYHEIGHLIMVFRALAEYLGIKVIIEIPNFHKDNELLEFKDEIDIHFLITEDIYFSSKKRVNYSKKNEEGITHMSLTNKSIIDIFKDIIQNKSVLLLNEKISIKLKKLVEKNTVHISDL
jgi:hypothetical protein